MSIPSDFSSLSNTQIDAIYKHDLTGCFPAYAGCYSRDDFKLEKITPETGRFYIVNCDKSTGAGTHWVLLYTVPPKFNYYFDPFGSSPLPELVEFVEPLHKQTYFSDDELQNVDSDLCGYYCIYISVQLYVEKRSLVNILREDFSNNTESNDAHIRAFFKPYMKK